MHTCSLSGVRIPVNLIYTADLAMVMMDGSLAVLAHCTGLPISSKRLSTFTLLTVGERVPGDWASGFTRLGQLNHFHTTY